LHALACCLKSFSFLILLDILLAMTSHTPISLTFRLVINLSLQTHKAEFQSQPRVKRWQCLEVSQGVYLPPNAYDRANVLFNLLYPNSICAPLSCWWLHFTSNQSHHWLSEVTACVICHSRSLLLT